MGAMGAQALLCRGFVSMGAVGAIAPTVFEIMGANTHGFW